MGRKTFLLFVPVVFFLGCAPALQPRVTPTDAASRTLGGAAIGAAAGAVGGAVVGHPAEGAAAGGAAGGLLGLLSSIFSLTVVDVVGAPYGGRYQAPYSGGHVYDPQEFCSSLTSPKEIEQCEAEFKRGAEEKRQRIKQEIEQEASQVSSDQVRYSGTVPEEYCTIYSEIWRQDACKRGVERGARNGYRLRENDIRRSSREAGYGSTW